MKEYDNAGGSTTFAPSKDLSHVKQANTVLKITVTSAAAWMKDFADGIPMTCHDF